MNKGLISLSNKKPSAQTYVIMSDKNSDDLSDSSGCMDSAPFKITYIEMHTKYLPAMKPTFSKSVYPFKRALVNTLSGF